MTTATSPAPSAIKQPVVPPERIWRISVERYHEMIRAGILTEDDPIELLEGWLVTKVPKNPPHVYITYFIREAIARLLSDGWHVATQDPLTTADSESEPDVMVVRGNMREYAERHPGPRDIALIIEVSDSTLQQDRTVKKRLYARAGIPVYWIANLPEQCIEVNTQPVVTGDAADYAQREVYGKADSVPLVIEGREVGRVPVGDLWS